MRSAGIVRKLDPLGRVVIPKEVRMILNLEVNQPLEVFVNDDYIVLKKFEPKNACLLTGEISNQNLALGDGSIILTPEAADSLLEELLQLKNEN